MRLFEKGRVEAGGGPADPRTLASPPGWELEETGLMNAALLYLGPDRPGCLWPFLSSRAQMGDLGRRAACSRACPLGLALKGTV